MPSVMEHSRNATEIDAEVENVRETLEGSLNISEKKSKNVKSPKNDFRRKKKVEIAPEGLKYVKIGPISRTYHWNDYVKCVQNDTLMSWKKKDKNYSLIPGDEEFIWFRVVPLDRPVSENDWFGNMRCSFQLQEFLDENADVNMYYVDTAYFGYSSASRILMTKSNFDGKYKKIELSKAKYGDPIMILNGEIFTLEVDLSKDKRWWGKHTTEFVVDSRTISASDLFKKCCKEAVNHSDVNRKNFRGRFRPHKCFVYNTNFRQECPFCWSETDTLVELSKLQKEGSAYQLPVEIPHYEINPRFRRNSRHFRSRGRVFRGKPRNNGRPEGMPNQEEKTNGNGTGGS